MTNQTATEQETPQFHHHVNGKEIPGLPPPAPCHFCGKTEYGGIVTNEGANAAETTYFVQCDSCGAEGPLSASLAEAAQRWNASTRRVAVDDRIQELRDELFGAMAVVAVVRDSINFDDDCDRPRALSDAYKRFYQIALELDGVSILCASQRLSSDAEVFHA